jgi:hypothetical protein
VALRYYTNANTDIQKYKKLWKQTNGQDIDEAGTKKLLATLKGRADSCKQIYTTYRQLLDVKIESEKVFTETKQKTDQFLEKWFSSQEACQRLGQTAIDLITAMREVEDDIHEKKNYTPEYVAKQKASRQREMNETPLLESDKEYDEWKEKLTPTQFYIATKLTWSVITKALNRLKSWRKIFDKDIDPNIETNEKQEYNNDLNFVKNLDRFIRDAISGTKNESFGPDEIKSTRKGLESFLNAKKSELNKRWKKYLHADGHNLYFEGFEDETPGLVYTSSRWNYDEDDDYPM